LKEDCALAQPPAARTDKATEKPTDKPAGTAPAPAAQAPAQIETDRPLAAETTTERHVDVDLVTIIPRCATALFSIISAAHSCS